jgi:copper chaperone
MCGTENRTELPLLTSAVGCSCCSSSTEAEPVNGQALAGVEFSLEGLTCGHCVDTVQRAVLAVDGVDSASVRLVAGGRSRLAISGAADDAAVRDAVTAASYRLISG